MRGRFLTGWVRSSRESPRAAAPVMAVTGAGKDRNRATIRKPLLMPRETDIPGWVAVPGWQGPAAERRQAAATDNSMASGHRRSRGKEGARPGPGLMRAERGNPVRVRRAGAGMRRQGGRPPVRGAEFPGRTGCPGSGCRAAERRQESGAAGPGTPPGWLSYNWPGCRILLSGLERALTWAGEPLRRERA